MLLADDRERDKTEAQLMLQAYETQLKYGAQVDLQHIHDMMRAPRIATPSTQQPVIPEIVIPPAQPAPPLV
jgi:hypothetical protein